MDTASILQSLTAERDRISAAIAALEGRNGRVGRRPGPKPGSSRRVRRRLSAAAKKRISEAAKARWAKAKKADRNRL